MTTGPWERRRVVRSAGRLALAASMATALWVTVDPGHERGGGGDSGDVVALSDQRAAVVSPLLDLFETGNNIGPPLVANTTASLIASSLPAPGQVPELDPLLDEVRSAVVTAPIEGAAALQEANAGQIDAAQEQAPAIAPANSVADPLLEDAAVAMEHLADLLDDRAGGPYGTSVRELAPSLRWLQSGQ